MTDNMSDFGSALSEAIRRAQEEAAPDLPEEHKAKWLQQLQDFYGSHSATFDAAVDGLLKLEQEEQAAEHVERFKHAMQRPEDPVGGIEGMEGKLVGLDPGPMQALMQSDALRPMTESVQAEGVSGLSVGVILEAGIVLGLEIGVDVLFELTDGKIYGRGFGVVDLGLDASYGIGLNVGIWQTLPTIDRVTWIGGFMLDVSLTLIKNFPYKKVFVRIMGIQALPDWDSKPGYYTFEGVTLAICYGNMGFQGYGKKGGLIGYRGAEIAVGLPPLRTSFKVKNCTSGTSPCSPGTAIVDQSQENTMVCTLTNTSEKTITVANGDKMLLKLPSYFASSDVTGITVDPPSDWAPPDDPWTKTTLTLIYNGSKLTWNDGDSLVITLENVQPSKSKPLKGTFSITIPKAEVESGTIKHAGVAGTAKVNLVPSIEVGCITSWVLECPDFNTNGNATSGSNVSIQSQDSQTTVVPLTTVTDGNGATWDVGYQCYIDQDGNTNFRPCLYKDGTIEVYGKTLDAPNFGYINEKSDSNPDGLTQTASYLNKTGDENYLTTTSVFLGDCSSDSES